MTYCLAIKVADGIAFAGDTRTNSGVDYVSSYRKLHVFDDLGDRIFVLLSAGNLGVSQELIHWMRRDLSASDGRESLRSCQYLFEAADYVGRISRAIQDRHGAAFSSTGVSGQTTLILGGQIEGQAHGIFLIYPQGNFVEASIDTPYLQIGENKYGKPMLDRLVTPELSLAAAARLALVSLDATIRSNVSVGAPIDLALYDTNSFSIGRQLRLTDQSGVLIGIREQWQSALAAGFESLPRFEWEED